MRSERNACVAVHLGIACSAIVSSGTSVPSGQKVQFIRAVKNVSEVMLPEAGTKISRVIQGGSDTEPLEQGWVQARVEEHEASGEAAGIGLDAADENALHPASLQMLDEGSRRQVAVLNEGAVGGNEALVVGPWFPTQLALEGGDGLVMPLDSGDRVEFSTQCLNPVHNVIRHGEARLNIDGQQRLRAGQ